MGRAATILLTCALALTSFTNCSKTSDEDLVRAVIFRAIDGANEKAPAKVLADVAPGFQGPGGADVQESKRILLGYFLQQGWIRVFPRGLEITVDGARATAKLGAVVARGNEVKRIEDVLPTNGDVVEFTLELSKESGDWKLTRASYRRGAW
ncbi:hypothetical protein L6R52_20440 [Myxococcota bacterium]|nr:hypothetical protein [Myxococcota bacterium]